MATLVRGDVRPGLEDLVAGVRAAVDRQVGWRETAVLVAGELRRHLPSPDVFTAEERFGDPAAYKDPEALADLRRQAKELAKELAEVDAAWQDRVDTQ